MPLLSGHWPAPQLTLARSAADPGPLFRGHWPLLSGHWPAPQRTLADFMEAALRVRLLPLCSELVIGVVAAEPRPIGKLEEKITRNCRFIVRPRMGQRGLRYYIFIKELLHYTIFNRKIAKHPRILLFNHKKKPFISLFKPVFFLPITQHIYCIYIFSGQ